MNWDEVKDDKDVRAAIRAVAALETVTEGCRKAIVELTVRMQAVLTPLPPHAEGPPSEDKPREIMSPLATEIFNVTDQFDAIRRELDGLTRRCEV